MFERFTERARRCIYFANRSAAQYNTQTVETEHLLLGILREDPEVIGRFLPSKTDQDIRAEVENRLTKRNPSVSEFIDLPLSNACKRSLAYAAEQAERLHHRRINIDHLLIGVVREADGMASQILRSAGMDFVAMRQQLHTTTPYSIGIERSEDS
jgi:ATP-dependent Clp protease ATP-binding subunit ClpC